MTSPRRVPIFDGHNDVLLRLYRRGGTDASRAFLEGEAKGQLDLPMGAAGRIRRRVVRDLRPLN
jgi:membrane dipeptidase